MLLFFWVIFSAIFLSIFSTLRAIIGALPLLFSYGREGGGKVFLVSFTSSIMSLSGLWLAVTLTRPDFALRQYAMDFHATDFVYSGVGYLLLEVLLLARLFETGMFKAILSSSASAILVVGVEFYIASSL